MTNIFRAEIRHFSENDKQTLGKWISYKNEIAFFDCKTLELAYRNNKNKISRIPAGIYDCEKLETEAELKNSRLDYPHVWIKNVPGRKGIKVHILNYFRQSNGCPGVGAKHTDIDGDGYRDVTDSKNTLKKLMKIMSKKFKLTILDTHKINIL